MEPIPLEKLKGVGPAIARDMAGIGITSVQELLHYYPRTYQDFSVVTPIKSLRPGLVTLRARVKQIKGRYVRRGMHITEAVVSDETGSVKVIWFNQPYREQAFKKNEQYFITGKLELRRQHFAITNPITEQVSDMPVHSARIVPVYRESKGVTATLLRKLMAQAVRMDAILPKVLPAWLKKKADLMDYDEAIKLVHFPASSNELEHAKATLGFIEIFEVMLAAQLNRQANALETAPAIAFKEELAKTFVKGLPFKLTDAQRRAVWQILQDMQRTIPMNRLLEGDVGSGKTVVAAMAAVMAMKAGYQVAMLAPTELLASQHADTILELLKPIDMQQGLSLVTGNLKKDQRQVALRHLHSGAIRFAVGTHALLQADIEIPHLGLLIIDEQHRFGVEQRKVLLKKTGRLPHILSMTATPIPRSLALTLYGELEISLLDAMPPGRRPIKTVIVSPNSRDAMYQHVRDEVMGGHQVYVVCPMISTGAIKTVSVEAMYSQLATTLKGLRLGLLHGKMKPAEKEAAMAHFVQGKTQVLIATTVIEVGVNVPNASVMIIEGADRFGLAQMHQLRGRVGRSSSQGYCYIVPSDSKAPSRRLRALTQSTNGFELAELDLEIRGPGAIYGTLQHGDLDLRFAQLNNSRLLKKARDAVKEFIERKESLNTYPELKRRVRHAQAVVTLN